MKNVKLSKKIYCFNKHRQLIHQLDQSAHQTSKVFMSSQKLVMLFVELFNPRLLRSSDLMSSFFQVISSKTVSKVNCSSCISTRLFVCFLLSSVILLVNRLY